MVSTYSLGEEKKKIKTHGAAARYAREDGVSSLVGNSLPRGEEREPRSSLNLAVTEYKVGLSIYQSQCSPRTLNRHAAETGTPQKVV